MSLLSICSHCKQHAWKTRAERVKLSQRSVFNLNAEKKVKQERPSNSQNSVPKSIQLSKGDGSSQNSSEVVTTRQTKRGKRKKKNLKMKKISSKEFDDKKLTDNSMLEKMSDLSLPSTPASIASTVQNLVERSETDACNQACKNVDETTDEEDMSDVENTFDDCEAVTDERKENEISSCQEEDDQECNATSEDEEQSQKENKGISAEKRATQQQCGMPQTSVTGKREEAAESEPGESRIIPAEYTVCRAEIESSAVGLPVLDINVIKKPFKPQGAKTSMVKRTEFCPKFGDKENTISSREYSEKSNENGAELLSKHKFSCDYTNDCCDMGTTEDSDEETPCDNGGSPSDSSNNNEGAF